MKPLSSSSLASEMSIGPRRPRRMRSAPQLRHTLLQLMWSDAGGSGTTESSEDSWISESESSSGETIEIGGSYEESSIDERSLRRRILHGPPLESSADDLWASEFRSNLRRTTSLTNLATIQSNNSSPVQIPLTDSHVCLICRGIFYYCRNPERVVLTHRIVDLVDGADVGCKFCRLVWSMLDVKENRAILRTARESGTLEYASRCKLGHGDDDVSGDDYISLMWPFIRDDYGEICHFVYLAPAPDIETNAGASPTREIVQEQSRTSSEGSLDLARYWLKSCVENHELCGDLTFRTNRLPTRLLSISDGGLLLCSGSELSVSTLYLTLSHRWGKTNKNRLTISRFENGPKFWAQGELLPTFQDATIVARRLGIKHLWIDSLCIIQDSDEDRARECGRMWEVYGNSNCNISATASMDGTEGLFRDHEPGGPSPCQISPRWGDSCGNMFRGANATRSHHLLDCNEFVRQIEDSPIGERAWVVQERLLAPRVLHFAESQVYWECREQHASETYPLNLPDAMTRKTFSKQSMDPCKLIRERQSESCYAAWRECVQLYSRCALTQPADKLVALSGIARRISDSLEACEILPDDYLAGLWRSDLLSGLLWRREGPFNSRNSYIGPYRAPTWSWASVDGMVFMTAVEEWADAEIVSAHTTTSVDPFGAVTAGIIDIRAPLLRIPLDAEDEDTLSFFEHGQHTRYKAHISDKIVFDQLSLDSPEPYDRGTLQTSDIHALLLGANQGLLLRPVTLDNPLRPLGLDNMDLRGTFTRIGDFRFEIGTDYLRAQERINFHEDPELKFKERYEDGTCLVTII